MANWKNKLRNKIKYAKPIALFRVLTAKMLEVGPAAKFLATGGLMSDAKKMHTELFIRTHALEKGMSIGNVRYGFGQQKAKALLPDLQHYLQIGGDRSFVIDSCSVINQYIKFNEAGGADMSAVKVPFENFIKKNDISIVNHGGIYNLKYEQIHEGMTSTFDKFSQSRFSVRDFGEEVISREDIIKALKLCERTPTACNRQSQRIHIFMNKEKMQKLFKMQKGCNGFIENMQGAILVCSDMRRYSFREINQMFVDGGLYAMNLLYALHYYNIANIPLTMAHRTSYLMKIKKEMNIPQNEQPVLLIGIGSYKKEYKAAQSVRYNWESYTEWE